jgi:UDP-N-acetyl-2-amino-2-deoxyglucuronate dehydrogenase
MKLKKYQSIKDRKIRIAVVGCGRISKNHFGSIEQHNKDIELAAVCDLDASVLEAHISQYQIPGYSDIEDLLNKEKIDIVALCTPSGIHPSQAILAAKYKINVLTEKPMGTRLTDGVSMVKACDLAGVRLFVVKQNRRNATLQLLKRAIEGGRFGKIYNVAINVFWTRPQEYYDQGNGWRGTWEFDGGAFMNQASHYVDLLDWLIGPVESVMAYTATQVRNIEAEDSGVALVRWRNGALGTVNVSMLTYPNNFEGSITILGEKGTVRIGGVAVNEIQQWNFSDDRPEDREIKNVNYATSSVYGYGHPLYYQNVIDVIRGKVEPETDGRSGLKSLEMIEAIYRSAKDGIKINLPLEY